MLIKLKMIWNNRNIKYLSLSLIVIFDMFECNMQLHKKIKFSIYDYSDFLDLMELAFDRHGRNIEK